MIKSHFKLNTRRLALLCALHTGLSQAAPAPDPEPSSLVNTPLNTQASLKQYSIPAGELAGALQTLASESGVTLTFTPAQAAGKTTAGINGRYNVEQAFEALLVGSGLALKKNRDQHYSLIKADQLGNPHQQQGVSLPEIAVRAQSERKIVTENSGSYTTPATAAAIGLPLSLRETPQSVSVFTRQRIEDQNLVTVADVLLNAPGIAFTQLDSERTTFSARGFSITDIQYDGINTSYKSQYAAGESELDSIIYDRIEIVRGSTGLLSGAGEPSASINLVRKRADSREFKGVATATAGSWGNYRATIDLSTPLNADGRVRGRLVAAVQDKRGFFERYARESQTVYGVVDVDITEATTLSLGASLQHSDAEGLTYGGVPLWNTDGSRTDYRRSFTVAPKWNSEKIESSNLFVNLDHHFDNDWNAQLRLMRSRNDVKENKRLFMWGFPDAQTGLVSATPSRVMFPGERTQDSVDIKLSGPFKLLGREHEAILGLSHFDQEYSFDRTPAATPWSSPFSVYDFGSLPEPAWNYAATTLSERNRTRQTSAYGALRLALSDQLKLILGGRLTEYTREGAGYNNARPYDYDDRKFIPYAGLVFDLNQHYSVYASYTSIFKYQDYRDRNGGWLAPVQGDAYETGIKGEFFDGKLNASFALFRIKQDKLGQQDGNNLVPGTTTPAYVMTSGATSKGAELEVSGQLAAGWNAFFFATRYAAKDASDNDFNTYLPRGMVRLFSTYQLGGDWQKLTVGGGANWQSRIYQDAMGPNGEKQEQSGYMLASLMARYQFSPKVYAQLNVNNLFDKQYQSAVNWYGQGIWGAPRNVQAVLNYMF